MQSLQSLLSYFLWPNPPKPVGGYDNPKVLTLLACCLLLLVASFAFTYWRRRLTNPVTKKLSRSWASAAFWFGLVGAGMVLSRTEGVSFLSMRIWWVFWGIAAVLYLFIQIKQFRLKHYEPLPKMTVDDPRAKYLPRKKR